MSGGAGGGGGGGEKSVLGLIKDLQAGRGAALSVGDRRRVVEHLWAEGYSVPEIAEVTRVNERTITRDRQAIRQANALEVYDGLVPEMVGALVRQADVTVARLRRVARDRETPAGARVEAELGCWQVGRELIESMQSLGYLPSSPQEVRASLSIDHGPQYAEFERELDRIQTVVGEEFAPQVGRVRQTIAQLVSPPPAPPSPPPPPPVGPADTAPPPEAP